MSKSTDSDLLDRQWMRHALAAAQVAAEDAEVPVGAVIVVGNRKVSQAGNRTEMTGNPVAHAEIIAIREAAEAIGSRRLAGATIYVTLEPCSMCAGALVLARVNRVVFGAYDIKAGACGSLRNVLQDSRLNHVCHVRGGVLQEECGNLLRDFFGQMRRAD